jgi:hypothetical protein
MNPLTNYDLHYEENDDATYTSSSTNLSEDTDFGDNDNFIFNNSFQINNLNKNILLIPEIYNKYFHGKTIDSDPNIDGQFLVLQTFNIHPDSSIFDFFKYTNNLCKFYKNYYKKNICNICLPHILLRNYNNIIKHPTYLNVQIGQIYYLKGDECVCVVKTIWLKLIQRAWKKIYKIRNQLKQIRCRPDSIMYRELCGKWPQNCNYLPSIRGMLL